METQYCPHCGSPVEEGSGQCRVCGASLTPTAERLSDPPTATTPPPITPSITPSITAASSSTAASDMAPPPATSAAPTVSAGNTPPAGAGNYPAYPTYPTYPGNAGNQGYAAYPGYTGVPGSADPSTSGQQPRQQPTYPGYNYPAYPNYPTYPTYPSYPYTSPQNYGSNGPYRSYGAPTGYPTPYPNYPTPAAGQSGQSGQPTTPSTVAQMGNGQQSLVPAAPQAMAPAPNAPGYPTYPQGVNTGYGNYGTYGGYPGSYPWNPYGGYSPYGYGYPYANPYAAYYPMMVMPRRAPGELYALIISWIVTFAGGLSIICGLLISLLTLISIVQGSNSLTSVDTFFSFLFGPVVGGGFAIYYGIRGIQRKPSPRFALPNPLLFLGLTVLVYIAAIALWHLDSAPGPAFLALPLVVLSSALPALTIISFTTWRLHNPTSRRHVWMSFIYGSTLAILIALILNTVGEIAVFIFELAAEPRSLSSSNPVTPSSPDNVQIIGALLLLSVVAPLVEEGVKPLGTVLAIRRLRSPAGAFLMGLAAGCGFSIFESVSIYIGQGQADWVVVAIERIGAGLLHGVGAGMGALGWYYLINGKGIRLRWWRGIGCIFYALCQHGIFNGLALFVSLPGPASTWLSQPVYIGQLPLDRASFIFFVYYAGIITVLLIVTGRLVRSPLRDPNPAPNTGVPATLPGGAGVPSNPANPEPIPVGSSAR